MSFKICVSSKQREFHNDEDLSPICEIVTPISGINNNVKKERLYKIYVNKVRLESDEKNIVQGEFHEDEQPSPFMKKDSFEQIEESQVIIRNPRTLNRKNTITILY